MTKRQAVLSIGLQYNVDGNQITTDGQVVLLRGDYRVSPDSEITIIGPDGQRLDFPAITAGLKAAQRSIVSYSREDLNAYICEYSIKPGQANPSDKPLDGGTLLAGIMNNGDAPITTPRNLKPFTWDEGAGQATEEQIRAQEIDIHHLMRKQVMNDYGQKDWRMGNMTFENDHADDESWMFWKFSEAAGGRKTFDKSGSFPAGALWSARRSSVYHAYGQWLDDGGQELRQQGRSPSRSPCAESVTKPVGRRILVI